MWKRTTIPTPFSLSRIHCWKSFLFFFLLQCMMYDVLKRRRRRTKEWTEFSWKIYYLEGHFHSLLLLLQERKEKKKKKNDDDPSLRIWFTIGDKFKYCCVIRFFGINLRLSCERTTLWFWYYMNVLLRGFFVVVLFINMYVYECETSREWEREEKRRGSICIHYLCIFFCFNAGACSTPRRGMKFFCII